jgi:hypothetical protein
MARDSQSWFATQVSIEIEQITLKISSPIRLKSAFGLVNDSPSMPKATAATTSLETNESAKPSLKEFSTHVVYLAAN